MYQPYSRYSNSNGYQHHQHPQPYQQEYQEYVPAPHQAQGSPVPYQQPSNPFTASLAPTILLLAQSKKGKKKKRTLTSPAAPMVPQPGTVIAPVLTATPAADQPTSSLPGHEWVLVAKGAATPAPSTSSEISVVVPEYVKVNAGLYQAQADLDKVQCIVESALICLLEPRKEYPLSKFGILDAYVPAHHIEVLTGVTTLASIIISGLEFFKSYGVPNQRRLLGKSKFAH